MGVREFAYMAGCVDMKGRLSKITTARRASPLYRIVVESRSLDVTRRLAMYTGTRSSVEEERKMTPMARRGCSEHCPDAHTHVTARMPAIGRWDMSGVGAVIVLDNLLPFLVSDIEDKREFIQEAVAWLPQPDPTRPGWAAIARTINRLHLLGWRLPEELGIQ